MKNTPLRLGAAYHGNRMLHHAYDDLKDMIMNGMDTVVHMLSHTDWERHLSVMKEMVQISSELGLESWMDNWGIGGAPGDKSHFLGIYPDGHMYMSDGTMHPTQACVTSPDYIKFTKEWIDAVVYTGAKTIFWDEPRLPTRRTDDGRLVYCCCCPRCRKLFEERYGKAMPEFADEDTSDFGASTIIGYFDEVTTYSASKGLKNAICVMDGTYGMSISDAEKLIALPHVDDLGFDPYWVGFKNGNPEYSVYRHVYDGARKDLVLAEKYGKQSNIWIQTFGNPRGEEEDIIQAAEAAYDAGARTILAWGYYGSISNDYGAKNPHLTWAKTCEAFKRIREMERDRILTENRRLYRK